MKRPINHKFWRFLFLGDIIFFPSPTIYSRFKRSWIVGIWSCWWIFQSPRNIGPTLWRISQNTRSSSPLIGTSLWLFMVACLLQKLVIVFYVFCFFYERNVYFLENSRPVRWWRAILHGVMDVVSLATRFIKVSVKRGSEPYLLNQSFDYVQNMLEAKTNRNLQVSCLAAKE